MKDRFDHTYLYGQEQLLRNSIYKSPVKITTLVLRQLFRERIIELRGNMEDGTRETMANFIWRQILR